MRCPQCNTENPAVAKFCFNCGAGLAAACPQCGTELPPQARFCFECGAPVGVAAPAAAPPAIMPAAMSERLQRLVPREFAERLLATRGQVSKERRVVTILFSDVKGSTAMAEKLDPEDWVEIMEGAFDVLIEPVYRYEGTLVRLLGDAILAFFGAPIAHEDDPERACRAALEIIEGAQGYAARLEEERGISGFNVRVGINTGLVVVGEVGSDLRVEYTAMGDAVNLAARMESAAEAGTVLITEDTHKFIAPLFETEALGRKQVKGKAEPVSVYRVLAARVAPGKVRGIAGLESPLVGREAEFGALRESIERLGAGVGGVVTIVGEAGLGKSRLVAELREQASADLQWMEGRCLSYGTSLAYLLWLDVLRGLLGVTVEDSPVAVLDALRERVQSLCPECFDNVYPYLGRLMSLPLETEVEATVRDLEGEKLKANTFCAVEMLIECAASERPLVLVCEDLHWADPTSMELLERLLALTDRAPLLILCVLRPQTEHGSWRLREIAARDYRHRHTDLWLNPLSAAESEVLVGNLLRVEDLPPKLKWRILSHAEGNPFYVEEVIRSLIDSGAIVQDEASGRWQATQDVSRIPIPDTLHGVLMARIDRLQEEAKRVLQLAAVIGRIFLYRVLTAIAQEERELDGHLITLQREEMIRERARLPELEYIFKHELTREAAYNGLLKKERRVFHRQVAEALERLFSERIEEQVGLLAHHWERAGEAEKATEYLLRAGDQARLAYAHQEAIDYYQRAQAFLKEGEEHERAARTLMKLGLTYHAAFDFQRSRQAYDEGFAMWQQAGQIQPATPPPAPHPLRILLGEDPRTLDPTLTSSCIVGQLFCGLVEPTPEMEVVPDVARRWEVLEGGRKYVFHLRDDVRWSDGASLTAHDFEYAWKRVLDPAIGSSYASLLYDVKGARAFHQGEVPTPDSVGVWALDEATLAVELEGPTGYFLHLLTSNVTYAVPRHTLEAHGEDWTAVGKIVTNGPFRLESWQRGKRLVLARSTTYHGRFQGNVDKVECLSLGGDVWGIEDWDARSLALYETDTVDVMQIAEAVGQARQRHAEEHVSFPMLWTIYLSFDVTCPPYNDLRVRRAFALAIDSARYQREVTKGLFAPATGGFLPPEMPGHSAGIGLPYDPARARRLLAEAGYPEGHQFPSVKGLGGTRQEADYLQAQWQENLGVEVEWEVLDVATAYETASRERPPLFFGAWVPDYPDPDGFLRLCLQKPYFNWHNEAFDRLVEQARRLTDQDKRMKLYRQADRILAEQAPLAPLFYGRLHLLVKPWVRKYLMSPTRDVFWKDVIIEPH